GRPIPSLFYSLDNSSDYGIDDVLVTERTYHVSGLFETSALTNQTVVCRAVNKHEVVSVNRTLIIRKPGDVPANVTWMFDENDSLFINWDPVHYPNGNVGYTIYFKNVDDDENKPWEYVQVNGNRTRFSIDESIGLLPDYHYKLKISATNERHEGPTSE
ncbi:fibronectin type III domain protein, partial [Ostertagia ostertagi]